MIREYDVKESYKANEFFLMDDELVLVVPVKKEDHDVLCDKCAFKEGIPEIQCSCIVEVGRSEDVYFKSLKSANITVTRNDGVFEVLLLKNKESDSYSFVNLTKEHICPCKFDSIADGIRDLEKYIKEGKIISYTIKN